MTRGTSRSHLHRHPAIRCWRRCTCKTGSPVPSRPKCTRSMPVRPATAAHTATHPSSQLLRTCAILALALFAEG